MEMNEASAKMVVYEISENCLCLPSERWDKSKFSYHMQALYMHRTNWKAVEDQEELEEKSQFSVNVLTSHVLLFLWGAPHNW